MMDSIISFFTTIANGDYVTVLMLVLSMLFISYVGFIIVKSMKNRDLSRLVISPVNGKLSHHRFWANVAYFLASVAFVKINFMIPSPNYIIELWAIYLTVIGGVDVFSKWISYKKLSSTSNSYGRDDSDEDSDEYYSQQDIETDKAYSMKEKKMMNKEQQDTE